MHREKEGRALYRHILIGLNQSAAAHRALQRAIQLAVRFDATLTAVAVTPPLPVHAAYAAAWDPEARQVLEGDQQASYAGLLERARGEAIRQDIQIETVLSSGPVLDSLFEAVRMNHIDLLVLGIPPDHEWLGWLSGSTAHELAVGAPCDILGVH
jgi:nucleotide-binding universal stress UspA family protein